MTFREHALEFEKLFSYYQFMQLSLWASGNNVIVITLSQIRGHFIVAHLANVFSCISVLLQSISRKIFGSCNDFPHLTCISFSDDLNIPFQLIF